MMELWDSTMLSHFTDEENQTQSLGHLFQITQLKSGRPNIATGIFTVCSLSVALSVRGDSAEPRSHTAYSHSMSHHNPNSGYLFPGFLGRCVPGALLMSNLGVPVPL